MEKPFRPIEKLAGLAFQTLTDIARVCPEYSPEQLRKTQSVTVVETVVNALLQDMAGRMPGLLPDDIDVVRAYYGQALLDFCEHWKQETARLDALQAMRKASKP